uniref:Uncharacterized protein n=1 Tax=Meloidogyne incognita TaxID=6306 RepID=A0A914KXM2_MELIC
MAKFFYILVIVAIVYLHFCECGNKSSDKKAESKGTPSLRVKGGSIFKGGMELSKLNIPDRNLQEILVSDQVKLNVPPPAPNDLTGLLDLSKWNVKGGEETGKN